MIALALRLNARPLLHKRLRSKAFLWHPFKSQKFMWKSRDRSDQQWAYTLGSYYHEMRKINQTHRESVVARVARDSAHALGKAARSTNSRQSPPRAIYNRRSHVPPSTHLGRRMETYQIISFLGDLQARNLATSY